jgi:hypothetical protein
VGAERPAVARGAAAGRCGGRAGPLLTTACHQPPI